jgi:uncharacterized repeat protein (TIGR01451 family)
MKILKKNPILTGLAVLVVSVVLGLTGPIAAFAATSPTLTGATSYSVVAGSIVTNTGATNISGDVGISPSIGVFPHYHESGVTTYGAGSALHDADGPAAAAQADNTAAYGALSAVPNAVCTDPLYQFGTGDIDLAGKTLVPGVYCADTFSLSGTLTLNDTGAPDGVWIFRSAATLITSSGVGAKVQFLNGLGLPCNVWWKVVSSATIGVGTTFIGNILASTSVALQTGATLNGRAMAQTGQVTMDTNTISGPTCASHSGGGEGARIPPEGTINVVKMVINDNGGTKTVEDFPLFVNITPVISGVTNTFPAPAISAYIVNETADPNYTRTFSGDCDINGQIILSPADAKFCIITNNDIGPSAAVLPVPPLIDVVKVPNPLALPAGPGPVTYTYTLRNIGTVPVTDVTMVGDTCSPIILVSGDTNTDSKLDVNETWIYRCSTTLSETHTNTVVATGWANGISATDIASATVVVGMPVVPPLIHVTKVPNPLALLAAGGMVTYTEKVTNPGTVALSNVHLTDDKCGPMKYVSGDTNVNLKLETTETWTFTCQTNLTQTTTNTATVSGEANGLTVRDFAIATVVVAPTMHPAAVVPKLPRTGVAPLEESIPWNIVTLAGVFMVAILLNVNRKKQKN